MTSREGFEAWYADQIWANGETWKDACQLAWKARDPEVARLVEALREAVNTGGLANDLVRDRIDALLREYEETRDE